MRILGLDVGDKRIGIAVSDPSGTIAQGVGQLKRGESHRDDLNKIKGLISQYKAKRMVVGLPKNMKGEEGFQAKKVRNFLDYLSSKIQIPTHLIDERLSTAMAERVLREGRVTSSGRKRVRDKIAAAIILQSYLDSQRNRR